MTSEVIRVRDQIGAAMSMYFETEDTDLWNPGNWTGRMFVSMAECISQSLQTPTGLHVRELDPDTVDVDAAQFRAFTEALRNAYVTTGNSTYRSLIDGVLAVAIVIADRAGVPVDIHPMEQWGMDDRVEERARSMNF
ncbi:DUF6086 family protein [Nocardia sp. CDC160]|uniref:DUF6086 family protein n=1 Tax=Nocardia sp. CDC160 TaxID=3112166 RepID=UPI002DB6EA43|nr:DUF6086 family protein [Nocardia sp. CDC160]MEC3919953.1 DUF6086 family protein [Nocardia sp. CDC160]